MRCARSGASYDARASGRVGAAYRAAQARGPRDPRLHLGHDRKAEGRDALARQHAVPPRSSADRSGSTPTTNACASCRSATWRSASSRLQGVSLRRVLNFVENPETVPENVREIAPTVFIAVPRIWEKFYSGVLIRPEGGERARSSAPTSLRSASATRSRRCARRESRCRRSRGRILARARARARQLSQVIGAHRARLLITGAAPISPDLIRWYMALGLDMVEVRGRPNPAASDLEPGPGEAGLDRQRLAPTEVKVSPDGELLMRGPSVFMGYLNQPEKTAETLRTAGCTPATSGASTPTATSTSPTG